MVYKKYHVKTPETMLNIAILIGERWKNPKSCTQEREITLADLKEILEKQWHGNTLYKFRISAFKVHETILHPINYGSHKFNFVQHKN